MIDLSIWCTRVHERSRTRDRSPVYPVLIYAYAIDNYDNYGLHPSPVRRYEPSVNQSGAELGQSMTQSAFAHPTLMLLCDHGTLAKDCISPSRFLRQPMCVVIRCPCRAMCTYCIHHPSASSRKYSVVRVVFHSWWNVLALAQPGLLELLLRAI